MAPSTCIYASNLVGSLANVCDYQNQIQQRQATPAMVLGWHWGVTTTWLLAADHTRGDPRLS